MREEIASGLAAEQKSISSKYLYDARGSQIFERICELPEYHVTRSENYLLGRIVVLLAEQLSEPSVLVEFGSGASLKTTLLLDAAPAISAYVPIDISGTALSEAKERLSRRYPSLLVRPVLGDFTQPIDLPLDLARLPRVGFFPGSTIGNFRPEAAELFLANAREMLGPGARFIIGADATRDPALLLPAYDDASGVTASFNLNLLLRLNAEIGTDFDLQKFRHEARWNEDAGRVEMHLVSTVRQTAHLDGKPIDFAAGESIHTENSYKYRPDRLISLAEAAGWREIRRWIGGDPLLPGDAGRAEFCILLLEAV